MIIFAFVLEASSGEREEKPIFIDFNILTIL
jgi:hypothetical protein